MVEQELQPKTSLIDLIINPETEIEKTITSDPEFITGAMWGKPRNGHPEGQVIYHIGEVLKNVDVYYSPVYREKLRLIAIIHDTFKYKVDRTKDKSGENHHAMIARRFAEKFISDKETLEIIELHDEAYNAWSMGNRKQKWDRAEERAKELVHRLGSSIDLYLKFYACDGNTGDKKSDDRIWFLRILSEHFVKNYEDTV